MFRLKKRLKNPRLRDKPLSLDYDKNRKLSLVKELHPEAHRLI